MAKSRLRTGFGATTALTAVGMLAVGTVTGFEGLRTRAYRDVIGVPTICVGETLGVKMGDVKTVEDCKWMLGNRLVEFESKTLQNPRCVKNPEFIPAKSYVAFLSLAYNIGEGAFCKSTVVRYLNGGDVRTACGALLRFNRAGGLVWKGLVRRRAEENKLCLEGLKEAA